MDVIFTEKIELYRESKEDKRRWKENKIALWFDPAFPMINIKSYSKMDDDESNEDILSEKYEVGSIMLVDDDTRDIELRIKTLIGAFEGFLSRYNKFEE